LQQVRVPTKLRCIHGHGFLYIYIGYKICLYKVQNGHLIMRHPHCIH
jgi:hypothetical protein